MTCRGSIVELQQLPLETCLAEIPATVSSDSRRRLPLVAAHHCTVNPMPMLVVRGQSRMTDIVMPDARHAMLMAAAIVSVILMVTAEACLESCVP